MVKIFFQYSKHVLFAKNGFAEFIMYSPDVDIFVATSKICNVKLSA